MDRSHGGLHTWLLLIAATGSVSACTAVLGGFDFTGKGTGGSASGSTSTGGSSSKATSGTAGGSTSTGSTSTGSTSTGSTGTSTSTGSTSTGTGGSPASCTPVGSVVQVLSPTVLTGATSDTGNLQMISDPGGQRAAVHILVPTGMTGTTVVASVYSQGLQDLSTVNVTASNFTAVAAYVTPGSALHVQGSGQAGGMPTFGQMDYQLDPNDESVMTSSTPTFTPWMTPPDCVNGYTDRLAIADPSASPVHYVASCVPNNSDGGMSASLWLATSTSVPPSAMAVGGKNDLLMTPIHYVFMNGTHVVQFSGNNTSAFSWTSSNPPMLPPPVTFTLVQNQAAIVLGLLPSPASQSFLVEAASLVLPSLSSASAWSGVVQMSDLAVLGQTPPPVLKELASASGAQVQTLGPLLSPSPSADGTSIYTAGQTLGGSAVNFSWLRNDGSAILLETPVYQLSPTMAQTTTIIAAGVGTLGPDALVAWIEKDTSATPATFTLNAHLVSCTM